MQQAGPACLAAPGGVPLSEQPHGTRGPCAARAALSPAAALGTSAAHTAGACAAAIDAGINAVTVTVTTADVITVVTVVAPKFRDASVFPSRARG